MKKNQLKLGAILSYVSLAISSIIGIIYTPFMTSKMGQSEYGLYSIIASIIGYLTVLDLGFGNAIIVYASKYRATSEKDKEKKLYGMFISIFIIIGLIATIIGLILYFNVQNFFGSTMTIEEISKAKIMMLILTFNLAITFPFSVFGSIITAHENFVFQKIIAILRNLLMPCVMIPLLFIGYKAIAMTVVITVLNIAMLLANTLFCFTKLKVKIQFGYFDKALFKEIFAYSFFVFLNVIIDKINWSVDNFILGAVSGTIAAALYGVAAQFNNIYLSFSTAISGVLLPKISKMVANKSSDEEMSNLFIKTGRLQYLIMALIITGFVLFGQPFINLLFGNEYNTSFCIACILMIPVTIPLIQNVGISILQAKNMHKFRSVLYFFIAVFNVIISIPLAKLYGGVGTAIGTSISLIFGNVLIMNIYYQKKAGINILKFWFEILKQTIPLAVIFIPSFVLLKNIDLMSWKNLAISIIIYSLIYGVIMYIFAMNKYEKDLLKKPILKIKNKFIKSKV